MDELLLRRRAMMNTDHDFSTPGWDGRVWAYYNITTTGSATTLLYRNAGVSNVEVDGVSNGTTITYTFSETGTHLVKIRLTDPATVPNGLFYNVTTVEEIYFPEGVVTIDSSNSPGAVRGCTGLKKVHFPVSLRTVKTNAFYGDTALTGLYIKDIDSYTTNISYANSGANPTYYAKNIYVNDVKLTSYTFPANTTSIRQYIFYNATSITNITLPSTVTTIGAGAFCNLNNTTFNLTASNIKTINHEAFYKCSKLEYVFELTQTTLSEGAVQQSGITAISLPNVVTIGSSNYTGVFYLCSKLKTIDIGSSCTKIYPRKFNSISNLEKLIVRATTPPDYSSSSYPWYNMPSTMKIYVPYSADHSVLSAYQNTAQWSVKASSIYELNPDGTIPTS